MPQQLTLPVYRASKSKDFPGFLIVWCPREKCPSFERRPFVVHGSTWTRPDRVLNRTSGKTILVVGRACPYCFATGRLPRRIS